MSESTVAAAVGYDELATLKLVAPDDGYSGPVKLSCSGAANRLDISNQTASRRFQRLEEVDFIDREIVSGSQWITITNAGKSALRQEYTDCRHIFETPSVVALEGQVTSGMDGGRHYVPLLGYMKQFKDRFGYEPFPGTLNVRLNDGVVRTRAGMTALDAVPIDGQENDERTFGPAAYYATSITVGGDSYEPAHIIVSEQTHHDESQLGIIAPDKLRDKLDLDDGDAVTVRVEEAGYK